MSFTQDEWTAAVKRYQDDYLPLSICEVLVDEAANVSGCFLFPSREEWSNYKYGNHYALHSDDFKDPFEMKYDKKMNVFLKLREGVTCQQHDLLTFYYVLRERDGEASAKAAVIKLLEEQRAEAEADIAKVRVFCLWLSYSAYSMGILSKCDEKMEWYYDKVMAYLQHVL